MNVDLEREDISIQVVKTILTNPGPPERPEIIKTCEEKSVKGERGGVEDRK